MTDRLETKVLCVALLSAACNGGTAAALATGTPSCDATGDPVELFALAGPDHLLYRAGVAWVDGVPVVAGEEVDAGMGAEGSPEVLVFHGSLGRLAAPASPGTAPIRAPVPVALSGARWGLLWASAEPPRGVAGRWPELMLTTVWWSERTGSGWSEPVRLGGSPLGLPWEGMRTLERGADGRTLLMVPTMGDSLVLFGTIESGLEPLPVPGAVRLATFQVGEDGAITVAVLASRTARRDDPVHLALMEAPAPDGPWTVDVPSLELPGHFGYGLTMIRGQARALHLAWVDDDHGRVRALHRAAPGGEWQEVSPPAPEGPVLDFVAGIDACGDPLLMAGGIGADHFPVLHGFRWIGSRWAPGARGHPAAHTYAQFAGVDDRGAWVVGWSGAPAKEGEPDPEEPMRVWVWRP